RQKTVANIDELHPINVSVLVAENAAEFKDIAPFASNYKKINDKTTIYVCENFSCKQPTNDMDTALSYLKDRLYFIPKYFPISYIYYRVHSPKTPTNI